MKKLILYSMMGAGLLLSSCGGNYYYEGIDIYGKPVKIHGEQGMYLEHPYSVGDTIVAFEDGRILRRGKSFNKKEDYIIGAGTIKSIIITKTK